MRVVMAKAPCCLSVMLMLLPCLAMAIHKDRSILPTDENILKIDQWSRERIQSVLESSYFNILEQSLIYNLQSVIIGLMEDLDAPDKLMSFYIAHRAINLGAARQAQEDAAGNAAWMAAGNKARFFIEYVAEKTARVCSRDSSWHLARGPFLDVFAQKSYVSADIRARYVSYEKARAEISREAVRVVQAALMKLALTDPEEIGNASNKVSSLFVLAFIGQQSFQANYLKPAYHGARLVLLRAPASNLNLKQTFDSIAAHNWEQGDLAINPFMLSLKVILNDLTPTKRANSHTGIASRMRQPLAPVKR